MVLSLPRSLFDSLCNTYVSLRESSSLLRFCRRLDGQLPSFNPVNLTHVGDPNVAIVGRLPLVHPTGVCLMRCGPALVRILVYPAWPFHGEDLPPFRHDPKERPSEDPELKDHTGPPDEWVMPITIEPVVRHNDRRSGTHRICDADVASIIGAANRLSHLPRKCTVFKSSNVPRDCEPV